MLDWGVAARILIADDEDSLRWVLEKGLTQAGYDVKTVKDGASAIRALEAEAFDLVFLDIKMPGIDGLTVLVRLRQIRADVQVVAHCMGSMTCFMAESRLPAPSNWR